MIIHQYLLVKGTTGNCLTNDGPAKRMMGILLVPNTTVEEDGFLITNPLPMTSTLPCSDSLLAMESQ